MRIFSRIDSKTTWILLVLLVCHSPLKWLAGLLLMVMALFSVSRKGVSIHEVKWVALLSIMIVAGAVVNVGYNQNIYGILLGVYLLSPMLLIPFIYSKHRSRERIRSAFKLFLYIQSIFVGVQYAYLVILTGSVNPLALNKSLGDFIAGTFISFSTPLAVSCSFIAIFFLHDFYSRNDRGSLFLSLASGLIVFLTGAMSVVVFLLPILGFMVVWKTLSSSSTVFKKSAYLLIFISVFSVVSIWQLKNIQYASYLAEKIHNTDAPLKVEIAGRVISSALAGDEFFWGVGLGNFSSRASLFLSGQYLSDQYIVPVSPSDISKSLILPYYSVNARSATYNGYDSLSVVSEPFNQYIAVLSEFGVVGLFIFTLFILSVFRFSWGGDRFLLIPCSALMLGLFASNNWLEYVSFPAIFYLVYACPKINQVKILK